MANKDWVNKIAEEADKEDKEALKLNPLEWLVTIPRDTGDEDIPLGELISALLEAAYEGQLCCPESLLVRIGMLLGLAQTDASYPVREACANRLSHLVQKEMAERASEERGRTLLSSLLSFLDSKQ